MSSKTHRPAIAHLARKSKIDVFTVNYRLAPQNPFPCAVIDAFSSYMYLVVDLGYSSSQIAFAGDSAGAGLVLALALVLKDWGKPLPACIYCQSPWVDLSHEIGKEGGSLKTNALTDYVKEHPVDPRRAVTRRGYTTMPPTLF